jgi:deoxyribodipyrimidine photo-lyase
MRGPVDTPDSLSVDDLGLEPKIDWHAGLRATWRPGVTGAFERLDAFLDRRVTAYDDERDRMDRAGTSELSPHLHFGEISPNQVWHAVADRTRGVQDKSARTSIRTYLREIGWREFGQHLLWDFPHLPTAPLRPEFVDFPWVEPDEETWRRWTMGHTGYPVVDAAMRQLWHTGWMHNRARMIVASFLVKDLRISWLHGARWFWDTLVDGDLGNNTLGWQWAGGCGPDAAPYFRIFNPVLQGKKFDPAGDYVRRWVPELGALETKHLHAPWDAPPLALSGAGVTLGETYASPIVDHGEARDRALEAFEAVKKG